MKFVLLLISFLAFIYLTCSSETTQSSQSSVKITIYYESLCPYCIRFFNDQFYPGYKKIASILQIDLIPYGNANQTKINNKWEFSCQHGEKECWGNKAHACGIADNKGQDKTVDYVSCLMGHNNSASEQSVNECAPKIGVPGQELLKCINSERGDELLAMYGEETHKQKHLEGVPAVLLNGVYDPSVSEELTEDFVKAVCKSFEEKPDVCVKFNYDDWWESTHIG